MDGYQFFSFGPEAALRRSAAALVAAVDDVVAAVAAGGAAAPGVGQCKLNPVDPSIS